MFYAAVWLAAVVPLALGLLILLRSDQRLIGCLLLGHGASIGLILGTPQTSEGGAAALVTDQLTQGIWLLLFLQLVVIVYLLPNGRTASSSWGTWLRMGLGGALLFLIGAAGDSSAFQEAHNGQAPPIPWLSEGVSDVLSLVGLVLVVMLFFGSVLSVRHRLRGAAEEERLQLLWPVWGALAVPLGLLILWANHFLLGDRDWFAAGVLVAVGVALPATIAIAILRHRLFDIRLVLSRTLTYGFLVVGVAAVYALLLLAAERLGGDSHAGGLVAVAVVAIVMHPAYSWLRRRIDRWVYGYRSEPHRALRLLADRAESASAEALDLSITTAVAEALRVDRVWVEAERVDDDERLIRTSLVHRGERLGDLVVEVPVGRRLSPSDVSLLHDLARYAAVLVRSERQRQQLGQSRACIVAGREEERRWLRRDLHDGVGPSLAAIVLKLDAVQSRRDEGDRVRLLAEAREEVRDAIAEVRRVVDDLRPAALDEVGLIGALRQRADRLSGDLAIQVIGPDRLGALPAAVEVAAFRIASEAMTNAARHSGATCCRVVVDVNDAFEVTVSDNGRGPRGPQVPGVGWTSMVERAAELGGRCTITRRDDGGLLVRAVLPIAHANATRSGTEARA